MNKHKGVAPDARISIIASGMKITGEVESDGIVKVEGRVLGNVRAEKQVLVARGGSIQGDIETAEAIVGGEVRGAIQATQRVEVQAGALVDGDIATPRIVVQEGGQVNGHLRMSSNLAQTSASGRSSPAVAQG